MFGTPHLFVAILPSLVFASGVNISSVDIQGCSSIACQKPPADNSTLCYFGGDWNYSAPYNVHSLGIAESAVQWDDQNLDLNLSFTLTNSVPEYRENNMTSYNQSLFLGAELRGFYPQEMNGNACAIMLRLADDRPFPDKERRNNTACEGSAVTEGVIDLMADVARDYKPAVSKSKQPCQDLVEAIAKNFSSSTTQYSEFNTKDIRVNGGAFGGKNSSRFIRPNPDEPGAQTCYPVLPVHRSNMYLLYYIASQPITLPGGKGQLKDTDRHLGMTPVMTVIYPLEESENATSGNSTSGNSTSGNSTTIINFMCLKASDSSVGGLIRPSVMSAFLLSVLSISILAF